MKTQHNRGEIGEAKAHVVQLNVCKCFGPQQLNSSIEQQKEVRSGVSHNLLKHNYSVIYLSLVSKLSLQNFITIFFMFLLVQIFINYFFIYIITHLQDIVILFLLHHVWYF